MGEGSALRRRSVPAPSAAGRRASVSVTATSTPPPAGAARNHRGEDSAARQPVGRTALCRSLLPAVAIGAGLWALWQWRGPEGAFVPGLVGHGPDISSWPRLFALWLPLGHVLFAETHAWLGRRDPGGRRGRHFLADQALSLIAVLLVAATLLGLRDHGALRSVLGAWYVLFVGAKTAVLLHAVWRWLAEESPGPGASASPSSSEAFCPTCSWAPTSSPPCPRRATSRTTS